MTALFVPTVAPQGAQARRWGWGGVPRGLAMRRRTRARRAAAALRAAR